MIDPTRVTNHSPTPAEREEAVLFWVCAAGKNGVTASRCLEKLLAPWRAGPSDSPFAVVRRIASAGVLPEEMRRAGIGCHTAKGRTFLALATSGLDLARCGVEDLEAIPGIGPKTARCFLIHSRPGQNYAGLDVHILSFLRDKGHPAPRATPTGRRYRDLEAAFLRYAEESGVTVAEYDLKLWNEYRARAKA